MTLHHLYPAEKTKQAAWYFLLISALAILYYCMARLGFTFAPGQQVTVIWPAAGLALASIFLFGYQVWPGILLGSFMSKLSVGLPPLIAFNIAIANTVEPLVAAALMLRYIGANHYFQHLKGVIGFWFFSVVFSTFVSALIGPTTVWLSGTQPQTAYSELFLTWWLADAGGALLITPLLMVWAQGTYTWPSMPKVIEGLALLVVSVVCGTVILVYPTILGEAWIYPYLMFPLVIWCALRFGQRGVTLMTLGSAHVALSATLSHVGPYAHMPTGQGLIGAQIYVMVEAMIGLTVAAAISECRAAEDRIRDSWEYLQSVIDHIPDPIFMKNRAHVLTGGNRALWVALNGPPEQFLGRNCDDVFREKAEIQSFHAKYDQVFETGDISVSEEVFTDHRGKRHVLSLKVALIKTGKREPTLVAVARDITERKDAEERMLRYTQELENSNRELDDFAYIASHDLKEPLRGMQSFSHFLLEDYDEKLDDEGKRKLRTISNLAIQLDAFLNVLLHYSRLGRTALVIERADMKELVKKSLSMFEISLKEKNIAVEIHPDLPVIACDRMRVTEVFRNLIGNAIKYNDGGRGPIEIGAVACHPRAPACTAFYVRDHGIGIDPYFLEDIFKMFRRLHPKGAYGGGCGAGLAIAKKIVCQHNGQIWAESEGKGQGAAFFFTIPQAQNP